MADVLIASGTHAEPLSGRIIINREIMPDREIVIRGDVFIGTHVTRGSENDIPPILACCRSRAQVIAGLNERRVFLITADD